MDIDQIDALIKKAFPKASAEQRLDKVSSSWIFLMREKVESVDHLTQKQIEAFKKFVTRDGTVATWKERQVEDMRLKAQKRGADNSEDEVLTFFALEYQKSQDDKSAAEDKDGFEAFERQKDDIKSSLPPVLFEALERSVTNGAEIIWTAGFGRNTLQVLCQRALIRLRFLQKPR